MAAVAPAWVPGEGFRLAYTDRAGRTVVVDADTGRVLRTTAAPAPDATIRQRGAASEVVAGGRVVFRGTGEFRDVARSPDGRWLLVTWPTADQWVFVRIGRAAEDRGGLGHHAAVRRRFVPPDRRLVLRVVSRA